MSISENFDYHLHSDILQTIPDKDLPPLRDIFRCRWPYAAQAWIFLNLIIEWKKLDPKTKVKVTCPEGKWQEGTFLAIMTEFRYQVYFFTLEPNCKKLCRAIRETKLIEWNKGPHIFAIHEDHDTKVMETLKNVEGKIEFDIETTCWWLPQETALNFDIKCPQNVFVRPLTEEHCFGINSIWPYKFPNSELYLANLLLKNGAYGVFNNSSPSNLCSWIFMNDYGAIATLQTLPEYKRKGYAALLIQYLAKKSAVKSIDSVAYILRKNVVSQSLFKSLGFKLINNVRWVQFKQLEENNIKTKL